VLGLIDAKPPYAVAVNLSFVPKTKHAEHILHENDRIEIIAPVTGG
jgi:sulfur carrier protein